MITVTGADATARKLGRLADELSELPAIPDIAREMAATASGRVRRLTGRLAGTIRPEVAGNIATLRAGGGLPYAAVQEFGGYHGISPNGFTRAALDQQRTGARQTIDQSIRGLIRRTGL